MLSAEGIDLEEFSHNFLGDDPPDSHVNGNRPIVVGYKSKGLEVSQLIMLPYIESIGDHISWMVELTTISVLGPNLLRTQRSIGKRLVMSNQKVVRRFNDLVTVKFEKCSVIEWLETLIAMSDTFEYPTPVWLREAINEIHTEMDEIRKKYKRQLQEDSNSSFSCWSGCSALI